MYSSNDQQTITSNQEWGTNLIMTGDVETNVKNIFLSSANTVDTNVQGVFLTAANTVLTDSHDLRIDEKKNLFINHTDLFFGFNKVDNESVLKKWFSVFNEERVIGHNLALSSLDNYFDKYENRLMNSVLDESWQLDFLTSLRNDSIHSTIPSFKESNLIQILENLGKTFKIKDKSELSKFLFHKSRFYRFDLDLDFKMVFDTIEKFLFEKNLQSKNEIELYVDHEIDDLRSVSVLLNIKGINIDQSLSYTDELIQRIAEYNDLVLEFIQIEISPL